MDFLIHYQAACAIQLVRHTVRPWKAGLPFHQILGTWLDLVQRVQAKRQLDSVPRTVSHHMCLNSSLSVHSWLVNLVHLIDWMSDTRSQGCTDLQSLIKCLYHRGIVLALDTAYICSQTRVGQPGWRMQY